MNHLPHDDGYDRTLDYRPTAAELAPDPEPCDGSGEIHGNTTCGYPLDPQNDVSFPCPGCPNCDPEEASDENE